MLTISKAFTIFFLLSLCGNREYPSSFQNKSVSSSFKWVPKYILFLAKLKGERSPFYREQTWIYSLNYLLHAGVMLTIIKVFIVLFVLCMWEQGTPWQFSKQINKLSFQLSVQVSFFLANLKRRGRPFLEGARKRGGRIERLPQEHLVALKDEKVCSSVKFEVILPLLCCLLDPLTNKQFRGWSSMTNLWIDSRTCQKYRILLSARQRSNNYLELSKEKVLGNMMLSY